MNIINISNKSDAAVNIDIEGIIGTPENWQFQNPQQKIATYETFSKTLKIIKELKAKNITVNIRSTGGNVNDALLIYDALKSLNANITTKCFGYVASAATIIAQAASNKNREISSNALYLIHSSACAFEGNAKELQKTIELLDKTDDRIAQIYASNAHKNSEIFTNLMNENNGNGRWLTPQETIDLGLADKIIGPQPINAEDKTLVKNLGLPPIPKHRNYISKYISEKWMDIIKNTNNRKKNIAAIPESDKTEIDNDQYSPEKDNIVDTANIYQTVNQIAKKTAKPTSTKPKEDPSPQDMKISNNECAYLNDIKNFI